MISLYRYKALASIVIIFLLLSVFPAGAFAEQGEDIPLPNAFFDYYWTYSSFHNTSVTWAQYNSATDTRTDGLTSKPHLPDKAGSYISICRTGWELNQNICCVAFVVHNASVEFFKLADITLWFAGLEAKYYGSFIYSLDNTRRAIYIFFYMDPNTIRSQNSSGIDTTPWEIRITQINDWSPNHDIYFYNYNIFPFYFNRTVGVNNNDLISMQVIINFQMCEMINYLKTIADNIGNRVTPEQEEIVEDVTEVSDELSAGVNTVDQFETQYNTQLQNAHNDVNIQAWNITQTNGMTYLKNMTQTMFTSSNGLRVFIMYPIIFVIIAIFLRKRE